MEVENAEAKQIVNEDEETELLLQDQDADEFRDEVGEEHNDEDVERLLGDNDEDMDESKEESTKQESEDVDSRNESDKRQRGRGRGRSFGPRGRGRGLLGRGPPPHLMPPGFFMGGPGPMLPRPPLRGGIPPLGGPPFMPPMMGFRGPMRPMMMMRGRGGGRNYSSDRHSKEPSEETEDNNKDNDQEQKPTPLMAIETPMMVRVMVEAKQQREREEEIAKRQQKMQLLASSRLPTKRSAMHFQGGREGSSQPTRGGRGQIHSSHNNYRSSLDPPPAKMSAMSSYASTSGPSQKPVMRSNLRPIQCVDEKKPQRSSSFQSSYHQQGNLRTVPMQSNPNLRTLTPCTNEPSGSQYRQSQPTHQGNLRTIPLTGGAPSSNTSLTGVTSKKVKLSNLSESISFDDLSKMTTICGDVKTIQLNGTNAIVEFKEASSVERFQKLYNRKMIKNSVIVVNRI